MIHKIKWHYISDEARQEVFDTLDEFQHNRLKGMRDLTVVEKLFNFYNEYVTFKYPKVQTSITCGSCVNHVRSFFEAERTKLKREQWQKRES